MGTRLRQRGVLPRCLSMGEDLSRRRGDTEMDENQIGTIIVGCAAHKKQLLTYLKLTGLKLPYLLNFGEALMKDGITRVINGQL